MLPKKFLTARNSFLSPIVVNTENLNNLCVYWLLGKAYLEKHTHLVGVFKLWIFLLVKKVKKSHKKNFM